MPAPYDLKGDGLSQPSAQNGKRQAVNLAILVLSWLHLGRPCAAPPGLRSGASLNRVQWATVRRLERYFDDLAEFGMLLLG